MPALTRSARSGMSRLLSLGSSSLWPLGRPTRCLVNLDRPMSMNLWREELIVSYFRGIECLSR